MNRAFLAVGLFLLVASPAIAGRYGTATMKFLEVDPRSTVAINDTRPGVGLTNVSVYTGLMKIQVWGYQDNTANSNPLPAGGDALFGSSQWHPNTLDAWCIDVDDLVGPGDTYSVDVDTVEMTPDTMAGPMGVTKASQLAWLLDTYWTSNWLDGLTDAAQNIKAAALQLTVWEVVNEYKRNSSGNYVYSVNNQDGTADNFYASSSSNSSVNAIKSQAQSMLAALTNNYAAASSYSYAKYLGLSNDDDQCGTYTHYQDFLVRIPDPVPVPAAGVLGVLGLTAAGLRLRRFA